ncbi:MAG: hypothetical protein ACYTF0_03110 [Planctomycetota bacterium]|jgi:hypothetical protein
MMKRVCSVLGSVALLVLIGCAETPSSASPPEVAIKYVQVHGRVQVPASLNPGVTVDGVAVPLSGDGRWSYLTEADGRMLHIETSVDGQVIRRQAATVLAREGVILVDE